MAYTYEKYMIYIYCIYIYIVNYVISGKLTRYFEYFCHLASISLNVYLFSFT